MQKNGYHNQEQVAFEIHLVQTIRPAFLVGSFQKNPQSGFSHVGRLSLKNKKKIEVKFTKQKTNRFKANNSMASVHLLCCATIWLQHICIIPKETRYLVSSYSSFSLLFTPGSHQSAFSLCGRTCSRCFTYMGPYST